MSATMKSPKLTYAQLDALKNLERGAKNNRPWMDSFMLIASTPTLKVLIRHGFVECRTIRKNSGLFVSYYSITAAGASQGGAE